MVKEVTVTSQMKYQMIVRDLERLGEIRVKSACLQINGEIKVVFRERTLGEFFKENLPWNKSLAIHSRKGVVAALAPLLKNERYAEQLLQNIQDRVNHNIGVTGYSLKCDYQPIHRSARPNPLQGGTVAAIGKGNTIQIVEADPAKIKCNHAVLRTSTAIAEASRHPHLKETLKELNSSGKVEYDYPTVISKPRSQPVPVKVIDKNLQVGVAATSWRCVADLKLSDFHSNAATISENDLRNLIRQAVGEQSGSVVIEVMPDYLEEHHQISTYTYTEHGLRAHVKAAKEIITEAKKKNKDLVITFACKDKSVLERMSVLTVSKNT